MRCGAGIFSSRITSRQDRHCVIASTSMIEELRMNRACRVTIGIALLLQAATAAAKLTVSQPSKSSPPPLVPAEQAQVQP